MAENKDDDSLEPGEPEIEGNDEGHPENSSVRSSDSRTAELTVKQTFEFSGPLPPPQILKDYNEAFAGCSERVVAMAEKQSAHRQALEKAVVESNCRAQNQGQWFAFIIALVVVGGGVYLLAEGKSVQGFATIIGTLVSLVAVLLYERSEQRKEREDKGRNLPQAPRPPSRLHPDER